MVNDWNRLVMLIDMFFQENESMNAKDFDRLLKKAKR
jgi:hypothetical protein